jgi:hypothetical protein
MFYVSKEKMSINMSLKLLSILSLIVCSVLIFSCRENDNTPANKFTYYDQDYPLKNGIIDLDHESSPGNSVGNSPIYFHKLYLLTDGISISKNDSTGSGSIMSLTLVSATGEIDAGTYFYASGVGVIAGDWTGSMLIEYNSTWATVRLLFGGKVTIARDGDVYTIDVDSPEHPGSPRRITAHYRGTLSTLQ